MEGIFLSARGKLRHGTMVKTSSALQVWTPLSVWSNSLSLLLLWQELQGFPMSSKGWDLFISLDKFGGRQFSQQNLRIVTRSVSQARGRVRKTFYLQQHFQEVFLLLGKWGRELWREQKVGKEDQFFIAPWNMSSQVNIFLLFLVWMCASNALKWTSKQCQFWTSQSHGRRGEKKEPVTNDQDTEYTTFADIPLANQISHMAKPKVNGIDIQALCHCRGHFKSCGKGQARGREEQLGMIKHSFTILYHDPLM